MRWVILSGFLACVGVVVVFDPDTEVRVLSVAMTVLAWSFVALYALRSNWRATDAGRTLMYTAGALGLLGTYACSSWVFGAYPFRNELRAAVVGLLVLTLVHRIAVLWRIQQEDRR